MAKTIDFIDECYWLRIPAAEIEQLVSSRVHRFPVVRDPDEVDAMGVMDYAVENGVRHG